MGNIDIKELLEKHGQGHIVKAYEALGAHCTIMMPLGY